MNSLTQFYIIMVLFIFIALFIVFATNNIYSDSSSQNVYIIIFVILFIIIIGSSIKFHKLYHKNRYFVYSAISIITIIFIVLLSVNTYMEEFISLRINGNGNSMFEDTDIKKKTNFKPSVEVLYDSEISDSQLFDNSVKVSEVDNVCVTDARHFGILNSKLKCISPYDEEQRREKEKRDRERREKEQRDKERRDKERHDKMCKSKYIPVRYTATQYCSDKYNNNNRYGVKSDKDVTECPGFHDVKCGRGYFNGKKRSEKEMKSTTQCYPQNSDFNTICQSRMRLQKNNPTNSNIYGYKEILNGTAGSCSKPFHSAVICSSDYYNGVIKTPNYTRCMKSGADIKDVSNACSAKVKVVDPALNIINTDGCNPGYKRYCCNKKQCMSQINGYSD